MTNRSTDIICENLLNLQVIFDDVTSNRHRIGGLTIKLKVTSNSRLKLTSKAFLKYLHNKRIARYLAA